jgi:thiol-disulfide isomerase/thioredoxin
MKTVLLLPLALVLIGCAKSEKATEPDGGQPAASQATTSDATNGAANAAAKADDGDVKVAIVDYQGIMERVAAYRGKVVVMDAWSTSCPPCMKEFHNLVELHKKYGPDKVACISLSFDYEGLGTPEEQLPRVLEFLKSQHATFENLMSNEESDALYRQFALAAVPAVFVYDQQGKLSKRFDNEKIKSDAEAFTYSDVGKLVAELLGEKPAEAAATGADATTTQ